MRSMRRLYDWVMHWAVTPHAELALFLLALTESFVFPIPPDALLIPMAVAKPRRAFRYGLICLVGSVLGGAIGFLIGSYFIETIGMPIVEFYGATDTFHYLRDRYNDNAILAIGVAGFTPIPYKIFTVSSGAFKVPFVLFIVTSAVSRGARFFLVAGLIAMFGEKTKGFIERYFNILSLAFVALLVLGFVLIKWVI